LPPKCPSSHSGDSKPCLIACEATSLVPFLSVLESSIYIDDNNDASS